MEHFTVPNDDRQLEFDGELLASATTASGKPRWTELELYRTRAGAYVLLTSGRSCLPGERSLDRALVIDSPAGVVEALHQYDGDGIRLRLSRVAQRLLREAADRDVELARAFLVESIE